MDNVTQHQKLYVDKMHGTYKTVSRTARLLKEHNKLQQLTLKLTFKHFKNLVKSTVLNDSTLKRSLTLENNN